MTVSRRPPLAHLVLLAALALAALIGGRIRFQAWGQAPVRIVVAYVGIATLLHAASRFTVHHSSILRALAWLTVAAMPLHVDALLRPEVIAPVALLGLVDLAQHRAGLSVDTDLPAGGVGKAIAGLATVGALAMLGVLVLLASSVGVLVRLGVVTVVAWALTAGLALRPATRTPGTLLGAAGAFAVTFALLAGPVVPLGPLMTYWVAIVAVVAAVLTVTFSRTEAVLRDEHRVHEQTVRTLPDPVVASLADRVREVVTGGGRARAFSRRVEEALDRDEGGRLLEQRARQMREEGVPAYRARSRALADMLGVDLDEQEESSP